jgi:hypothetical protein
MSSLRVVALAGALFFVSAGARAEEPKGAAAKSPSQIEEAVYKAIMSGAGAIDACTDAYTAEYPEEKGNAKLDTTVVKSGDVSKVKVSCSLQGTRNLIPCLEKAAKTWKFPKLNEKTESVQLSLTVQIHKGVKFNMKKPGEKDKPAEDKKNEEDEGFIYFFPTGWVESPP